MAIAEALSLLALRGLAIGVARTGGGAAARAVATVLSDQFNDHAERLPQALQRASDRAWRAFEIALSGESWVAQLRSLLTTKDERAFQASVKTFLQGLDASTLPSAPEAFRAECLAELREARERGDLVLGAGRGPRLAKKAAAFARYDSPAKMQAQEDKCLGGLARELDTSGYLNLARFLKGSEGPPLLVVACRFFFRREIEKDEALFRTLTVDKLDRLSAASERGLDALDGVLRTHGDKLDRISSELIGVAGAVEEVLQQVGLLHKKLEPRHSFSIRSPAEMRMVREALGRFRALPTDTRETFSELLNDVGKVEVAAGQFARATTSFEAAARASAPGPERAEARYNAYRALLERSAYDEALEALKEAIEGDASRFATYPHDKYEALRILGAGGFGVAILCRHRYLMKEHVVKAITATDGVQDLDQVFEEARYLDRLSDPAIIDVIDCGYMDVRHRSRPYILMEFFDGPSLESYVLRQGVLTVPQYLAVARPMARGLRTAHRHKVLHRDVKPGNVLVRPTESGFEVKLIDFGLALGPEALLSQQSGSGRSLVGTTVAGTFEYAPPEQLGRLPGAEVGPYSDVYSFGKTSCYALFGTTQPLMRHWRSVPDTLVDLLEACLQEDPESRLPDFDEVLRYLDRVEPAGLEPDRGEKAAPPPRVVLPELDERPEPPERGDLAEPQEEEPPAPEVEPVRPKTEAAEPAPAQPAALERAAPAPEEAAAKAPEERAPAASRSRDFGETAAPAALEEPGRPAPAARPAVLQPGPEGFARVQPAAGASFLVEVHPPLIDLPTSRHPGTRGAPTTRAAARRALAGRGLRLPTAAQVRAAMAVGAIDALKAPVWLREEPLRVLLPNGQCGHPALEKRSGRLSSRRTLLGVRELRSMRGGKA